MPRTKSELITIVQQHRDRLDNRKARLVRLQKRIGAIVGASLGAPRTMVHTMWNGEISSPQRGAILGATFITGWIVGLFESDRRPFRPILTDVLTLRLNNPSSRPLSAYLVKSWSLGPWVLRVLLERVSR
jgi:hypothetical protein